MIWAIFLLWVSSISTTFFSKPFTSFLISFIFSWLHSYLSSMLLIQFPFESVLPWTPWNLFFISELILFSVFPFVSWVRLFFFISPYLCLFLFIVFDFLIQVFFLISSNAGLSIFNRIWNADFFVFFCFLVVLEEGWFYSVHLCDILFLDIFLQ